MERMTYYDDVNKCYKVKPDMVGRSLVQELGWLTLCMSEDISIERANFRMIYEAEAKRRKREQQIPPRVKQITAGFELKGIEEGTA